VLAVLALLVAGCSDTEQAKRQFFENGERLLKENKYQEAIVEFRNALQQDDKYGEARLKLAEAYTGAGNADFRRIQQRPCVIGSGTGTRRASTATSATARMRARISSTVTIAGLYGKEC